MTPTFANALQFAREAAMAGHPEPWPLPKYERARLNSKGGYRSYEEMSAEYVRRRAAAWGPNLPPCRTPIARYVPDSNWCRCGYAMGAHRGIN